MKTCGLALTLLALGAAAAAPRLPSPPSKLQASKLQSSLALRGGADIGAIGATQMLQINSAMYVYFVSLFAGLLKPLPNLPFMGGDPYDKFGWGEENKPMQVQLVAALTYFGIMLLKDTFVADPSTHMDTAKALFYAWAVCAAAFNYGTFSLGCTFTESNILTVLMTVAYGYIVWA